MHVLWVVHKRYWSQTRLVPYKCDSAILIQHATSTSSAHSGGHGPRTRDFKLPLWIIKNRLVLTKQLHKIICHRSVSVNNGASLPFSAGHQLLLPELPLNIWLNDEIEKWCKNGGWLVSCSLYYSLSHIHPCQSGSDARKFCSNSSTLIQMAHSDGHYIYGWGWFRSGQLTLRHYFCQPVPERLHLILLASCSATG